MATQEPKVKLRRQISVWGSFCWGYADVGADVYVALGLVIAAARGATPFAFAIAGIIYYIWYRHKKGHPIFGSIKRDWDAQQLEILADTRERELYEQLRIEIERRKRRSNGSNPTQHQHGHL